MLPMMMRLPTSLRRRRLLASSQEAVCEGGGEHLADLLRAKRGGPARPHGVIRFQHRRKINRGSPSQALTPYFSGFFGVDESA